MTSKHLSRRTFLTASGTAAAAWPAADEQAKQQGLIDCQNDAGNRDLARLMRQPVTAARTTGAFDEPGLPQLAEKLLEVFLADLLSPGDVGKRNGMSLGMLADVDHRHDGIAAFGAHFHARRPNSHNERLAFPPLTHAKGEVPSKVSGGQPLLNNSKHRI